MRYLTIKEIICATMNYLYVQKYYCNRRLKHLNNALFNYLEWIISPSEVNKFKYCSDLMLFKFEKKFHNKIMGDNKYIDIFKKMSTKDENGQDVNYCCK